MKGRAVFAVDVGGTDIKSGTVDDTGRIGDVMRTPTPVVPDDGAATADAVVEAIAELLPRDAVGTGVVIPGWVDDAAGVAVHSENLGWRNYPFRDRLAARLGVPVRIGHDVRAAGLAEYRLGAARGHASAAVMPIGTGIAAALFLDGRLYSGGGLAGEIGHMKVADGPACACGASGCLEAVASARAIGRRYEQATGIAVAGAREVLERRERGDAAADAVWTSALDALGLGLAALTTMLAPEIVVLGGGLAAAGEALLEPLRARLTASLTFQRAPLLARAQLGQDAGLVGAGLLAADAAGDEEQ